MKRLFLALLVVAGLLAGCSEAAPLNEATSPPTSAGYDRAVPPTSVVPAIDVEAEAPFDFTRDDLCEWFTPDEILGIVADAYEAEGVDYPVPTELEARRPSPEDQRPGCDWTVPGTPYGWGYPDFTVAFRDDSGVHLATESGGDGPTILQSYHDASATSVVQPLDTDNLAGRRVLDLAIPGVVSIGGWSPGFGVHIESVDRIIDFRHDLSEAIVEDIEDFRVEYRILAEMLGRMHWLPASS